MSATRSCPRCATPARGDQDYCLACGLPFSRRRRTRRGLDRDSRLLPALALLVVGAVGALASVAFGGRGGGTPTIVATGVRLVAAPAASTTLPVLPVTTVTAPPAPVAPTTTTRSPSALTAWTLSDGYTVVLVSVPRANGRASAEEEAKLAFAKGLHDVGVLDSNRFASLTPGYFVVFSGVFTSSADASAHLAAAHAAGFQSAYERQITR